MVCNPRVPEPRNVHTLKTKMTMVAITIVAITIAVMTIVTMTIVAMTIVKALPVVVTTGNSAILETITTTGSKGRESDST